MRTGIFNRHPIIYTELYVRQGHCWHDSQTDFDFIDRALTVPTGHCKDRTQSFCPNMVSLHHKTIELSE